MMSTTFAVALAVALVWSTCFSLANHYPLRGLRNMGILACYVIGLIMFLQVELTRAVATWVMFGVTAGLLYVAYEVLVRSKAAADEEKPPVSLTHLIYAQLAWPIMGPEAAEYLLSELGILKTPPNAEQHGDDEADLASPDSSNEK